MDTDDEQKIPEAVLRNRSTLGRLLAVAAFQERRRDKEPARAPAQLHLEAFREWVNLPLQEQTEDLMLFLSSVPDEREALDTLRVRFEQAIPAGRPDFERRLALSDLEIVVEIVREDI
jgi:hypothetical protein